MSQLSQTPLFAAGPSTAQSLRLLELPPALLQLLDSPSPPKLTIKSSKDGLSTVLTTPSRSFLLKSVSQSNSLLIFRPDNQGLTNVASIGSYLEAVPSEAKVDLSLVSEYDGESDPSPADMFLTKEEVQRRTPASDAEFEKACQEALCVTIDGALRRLAPSYIDRLLELIITTIVAEGMALDSVALPILLASIGEDEENPDAIETVLAHFSSSTDNTFALSPSRVCTYLGTRLLASRANFPTDKKWSLTSFISAWRSAVPHEFATECKMEFLKGEYISVTNTMIEWFPVGRLPTEPAARFMELFLAKPKWELGEIQPYIQDLAATSTKVDALLLQHARKRKEGGKTIVTSRR
ncbi:Ctf8p and Ctf18p associating protein [Saitoella coloradoensis]